MTCMLELLKLNMNEHVRIMVLAILPFKFKNKLEEIVYEIDWSLWCEEVIRLWEVFSIKNTLSLMLTFTLW